jgi:hypothetical protein
MAAELGEPVRNFGVGGFSVYQAYTRMLREEEQVPAEHIIFNIFDDDHYRSLGGSNGGWSAFRNGGSRPDTKPAVFLDPNTGDLIERGNPCPGLDEMVAKLTDLETGGPGR